METAYKIIFAGGSGEIVEKKSRFIASAAPADTEEKALQFIEKIKKEHWSARHNCYAYVIGDKQQLQRFSDDGEPAQTAGRPMLDVLLAEGIHNGVVVVTRYFGGILLGTGGLVRAYKKAASAGIAASTVAEKCPGRLWRLLTDYNGIGKITYLLAKNNIPVVSSDYGEDVCIEAAVAAGQADSLKKALTEATSGRIRFLEEKKIWFAVVDGKVHIFDMETEECSR